MPWIHINDQIALIDFLLHRNDASGPYNACAPKPVRNREFAKTLGSVLHRPAFMPMPALALKVGLGEMSLLLLGGQKAVPARLLAAGFTFRSLICVRRWTTCPAASEIGRCMTDHALLLVNLGSPASTSVADVRSYLNQFLMDPYVIDLPWPVRRLLVSLILIKRPEQSAHAYASIWWEEGSPLVVLSRACNRQ